MLPYGRKNPLPFPYFGAVAGLWSAPDHETKGNGSPKRVETAGVYPFDFRGETAAVPLASQAKLPPVCTGKANLNYRESRRFLNPVRHCKTETFI